MQTKKWGPSAWEFVHTVAFRYPDKPTSQDISDYKLFFQYLGTQLPCKYCRESWAIFKEELPIEPFLESKTHLGLWSYLMHNKVNNKLRKQGNPVPPDPTFNEIYERYLSKQGICSQKCWDFLHAITYNYPMEPTNEQKKSTKMFFSSLKKVFPCGQCREIYNKLWTDMPIDPFLDSRLRLCYWLYQMHSKINRVLVRLGNTDITLLTNYDNFCERYEAMRAQCSQQLKTCSIPVDQKDRHNRQLQKMSKNN